MLALPRCASCWDDPDDPKLWIKKIEEAKTRTDRETALFNLYRIYELNKAMMERDDKYKKKIKEFRKLVNPVLVKVFRKKIKDRYLIPAQIVEKLVIFEADITAAADLFTEIINKYTNLDAEDFGDEDRQETLAGKAVDGLAKMAARGSMPAKALDSISKMIDAICKTRGSGRAVEGLDPRSFVRNSVVKSVPNFLKAKGSRGRLAGILSKVIRYGQLPKSGQDPMVTIFGIRLLGDVGDLSDTTVESLVRSLLGKGRGRRFYSFAATAVAKLPLDGSGNHPAVEPLLLMLGGDPWMKKIMGLKSKMRAMAKKRGGEKKQAYKNMKAELEPFEKRYKEKKIMHKCPFKAKYKYICELFWQANVEEWSKTEPGVIPMNAVMVLREIGDTSDRVIDTMIANYGVDVVKKRWLDQANNVPGMEERKDKRIPGVQMQKMMILSYGRDMNLRSVMLRSLGRMGAMSKPKVAKELLRSLTWAGDPTMMVKAGEGGYLARFNKKMLERLIELSTKAASAMMVNFKKRQVKMFFWGKVVKGTCPAGQEYEQKFKKCLNDVPEKDKQGKKIKDANWYCFDQYKKLWLPEFYYAIGYHKPGDKKRWVQEFCRKTDPWWNNTRKTLEEKAKAGGNTGKRAKLALFACSENPDPRALKKRETVKCGEWSVCDRRNNMLCLDGHWQLRMHFHKHAALLTTPEYVETLIKHTAEDLMSPHGIKEKSLPKKEGKEASSFFDSDDKHYLNKVPWPNVLEKLRVKKARIMLEKTLCHHREYLWVVKECGSDINKYINVVKGVQKIPTEDCSKLKGPFPKKISNRATPSKRAAPSWRAKLKALRMIAYFAGQKGKGSSEVKSALRAVIDYYVTAGGLAKNELRETREMVLLVLDRIADHSAHKDVMCHYPYSMRRRNQLRDKYNIPGYEDKLARAKRDKKEKDITKWKSRIKKYSEKVKKELEVLTKEQPCFKIFKLVIEDETSRRVKGVWQINRDARNTIGRLARRAKMRYDQI
jgi:flagellar motility protein MotE (MotC chaperone)